MASEGAENRKTEFRVGLFLLIGLLVVGGMVVEFGKFGTRLRKSYKITVELPNASGLLKNSKVLMAGAQVGSVSSAPRVLAHAKGVAFDLTIFETIRIPRNAQIVVGSAGMLGDRFVDVIPQTEDVGGYLANNETVRGIRQQGMDDLTREGGALVGDLRKAVANLNGTITRVNTEMLKPEMFKDMQGTLANLHATTQNFLDASAKLTEVLDGAKQTVGDARGAIDGAKGTLTTAQAAAEDVRGAIADARKVIGGVRVVTDKATKGDGILATALSDKTLSDDLRALVSNLRRSGVLFYRDRAASPSAAASPAPPATASPAPSPAPRRRGGRS